MRNLNRNYAYREFRRARYKAMTEARHFSGLEGAMTLRRYSQLGMTYVHLLEDVITENALVMYERFFPRNPFAWNAADYLVPLEEELIPL